MFLARKATYAQMRQANQTTTGQLLWGSSLAEGYLQPMLPTLLGYPVHKSEFVPAIAVGGLQPDPGRLEGYYIFDRVGLSIARNTRHLPGDRHHGPDRQEAARGQVHRAVPLQARPDERLDRTEALDGAGWATGPPWRGLNSGGNENMATIAKFDVLPTLGAAGRTCGGRGRTTYSGATVDLASYVNPGGRQLKALLTSGQYHVHRHAERQDSGVHDRRRQDSRTSPGPTFTATADTGS